MCSEMFVESVYVTKLLVESIFDFALHKCSSGVCRLHKNAVRLQKGMTQQAKRCHAMKPYKSMTYIFLQRLHAVLLQKGSQRSL